MVNFYEIRNFNPLRIHRGLEGCGIRFSDIPKVIRRIVRRCLLADYDLNKIFH